jgi:hypothetical protein
MKFKIENKTYDVIASNECPGIKAGYIGRTYVSKDRIGFISLILSIHGKPSVGEKFRILDIDEPKDIKNEIYISNNPENEIYKIVKIQTLLETPYGIGIYKISFEDTL